MTAYQDISFTYVDSPLNQPDEDVYWWTEYGSADQRNPMDDVQQRMVLILLAAVLFIALFGLWVIRTSGVTIPATNTQEAAAQEEAAQTNADAEQAGLVAAGGIAPLFTKEVQHWAPQIVAWSAEFGIDPNMAATVMQIESCGDPNAVSGSGAQGLFQVMPFHFSAGETMQDPDTNARRGLAYLALGMEQTGGDTGRSFAGYNGGHGTAARAWETWPAETQRYYVWSTGIYEDAVAGSGTSETLNEWLAAGGAGLCQQASARLGLQ
jgi:soluble lytic murein transglycosylase-like protein